MSIKELRKFSGMTQQAFGDYFGIPLRTIQNWEGGQRQCPEYLLDLMKYKLEKEHLERWKLKLAANGSPCYDEWYSVSVVCSGCGSETLGLEDNYCSNCGAKMIKELDEEDNKAYKKYVD